MNGNNNNLSHTNTVINRAYWLLKITYGIVPILAGLDKFGIYFISSWLHYLNPWIMQLIPLSAVQFMYVVGLIEVVAGLLVLTCCTRLGAYLVAAWLIIIAATLFHMRMFIDVGIRDVVMAMGAIVLAWLADIKRDAR